jgi:hypothetical protein
MSTVAALVFSMDISLAPDGALVGDNLSLLLARRMKEEAVVRKSRGGIGTGRIPGCCVSREGTILIEKTGVTMLEALPLWVPVGWQRQRAFRLDKPPVELISRGDDV